MNLKELTRKGEPEKIEFKKSLAVNENYIGVCVRTREDNEKLVNAIKEII